jgi:protoporphyrinogen oxidase
VRRLRYLILGAGPSGLAVAHRLLDRGVPREDLLVLEKESSVGGLCRSQVVDGSPLDQGGGHFLDTKRSHVLQFLFRFLPEGEWQTFHRVAKIWLDGNEVEHPLEANLWQLPVEEQVAFLESIALAGCLRGEPMPDSFPEWVRWKLGRRIADRYMLPYNRKLWGSDLNNLGTYWLHKLPQVSFKEALLSCLERRPFGELPAHGTFLYPKHHGYGEVWRRMGEAIRDRLVTSSGLERIDLSTKTVNGQWCAETIISTIPWPAWIGLCDIPAAIRQKIDSLKSVSIDVDYVPDSVNSDAHWIYHSDENTPHHRLLLRANFCTGSRGHWTEANSSRSIAEPYWRYRNEYAYPISTRDKPKAVEAILNWSQSQGIFATGRWGKWDHMNSDVAVSEALTLTDTCIDRRC